MAQHAPNLVDGATLALIFGVASSTIPSWRRSGMPVHREGSRGKAWEYDTQRVVKWLVERQVHGEERAELDLQAERARLAHHQANKTALEEGLLAGEIVKTEDVLRAWQGMIGAARAKLLTLPPKLVNSIHGKPTEEAIQDADGLVREVLGELEGTGLPGALERALGESLQDLEAAAKT